MKPTCRKPSFLSWLRRPRTSARRPSPYRPRPLGWEELEDRTLLSGQPPVVLGSLAFSAPAYTQVGHTYTFTGRVEVGTPSPSGDTITSLIDFNTDPTSISVSFNTDSSPHTFTVTTGTLETDITGQTNVPVWKTTGQPVIFNADDLASGGIKLASLTSGAAQPFAFGVGNFTPASIRLDTAANQVKLQGSLTQEPLDGLSMVVDQSNFLIFDDTGMNLTGDKLALSGSLSVGGLGFDISNLSVGYGNGQFTLTGSTTFQVEGNSITANFTSPGLVVQNGSVTNFNLAVTSSFSVGGLNFTTKNLSVGYNEDSGTHVVTYAVAGSASFAVAGDTFNVAFGSGGSKGLVITNGTLQSLDMSFVGSFHLLGVEVDTGSASNPLTITYTRGQDLYTISGTISLAGPIKVSATLGGGGQPGILIHDGKFEVESIDIKLNDVNLGAFTLNQFEVKYDEPTDTITVKGDVWFPEGWKLHGAVGFQDGKLNTIGIGITGNEGIEIADTGLMITGISAELQNLQHPADLIVSGSLTAVWGTSQLIQVTGGFKVDRNELVMDASVSVLGGWDSGSGQVVLDWGDRNYSIQAQLSSYDGIFTFQGFLDLSNGGSDLYVRATADVNVPDHIPFIGGKTLAGLNFVLELRADDKADSFAAAWVDADFLLFKVDIGVKVTFGGSVSVIGSSAIKDIEQPPPSSTQPQVYYYDIPFSPPEGATQAMLQVQWPQAGGNQSVSITLPDGTTYDQSQFSSANGLSLVPQYNTRQQYAVSISGSSTDPYQTLPPGNYVLHLKSDVKFPDGNPQPTMLVPAFGFTKPVIVVAPPPANPTQQQITVRLSGRVTSQLGPAATTTVFFDSNPSGYHGTPIAQNVPVTIDPTDPTRWTANVTWDLDGLLPFNYYVYAAVNDTVNGTVYSDYASPVQPTPPLSGTVVNPKNGQALRGFTVYLDQNNNGRFDPSTDPYTTTGPTGFYSFGQSELPLNKSFFVGVVIPSGYQIDGGGANFVQRTYDGTQSLVANFGVDEFAAIEGSVTADLAAGSQPLTGWTVYLDANGDGTLDAGEESAVTDSLGHYAFHDVAPGTTQTVRLQVATEHYQTGPAGNGSITVTLDADPFHVYQNQDFTALPFSTVSGNVAGYPLQNGSLSPNTTPLGGWTVQVAGYLAVDAGGTAVGNYQADQGSFGSSQPGQATAATIDTSRVPNPAPQAVYQTNRVAIGGQNFGYTLTGLTPGAPYTVRLHFAETYAPFKHAGKRVFNVAINGQQVLGNFDIFVAAGNRVNTAVARTFTATADPSGTITLLFTSLVNNAQINGIEVTSAQTGVAIDAGGQGGGAYLPDQGLSGSGHPFSVPQTQALSTDFVTNPAPTEVYRTATTGPDFSYTVAGLAPGAPYTVRLHFAEIELDDAGDRTFRVAINGQTVLDNFDIFAAAQVASGSQHGKFIALTRSFGAYADAGGQITIHFTGEVYNALVNAIELIGGVETTTTDATGNYTAVGLRSGTYTVTQAVPSGWRQVAPFGANFQLQYPDVGNRWHLPGSAPDPTAVAVADFNGDGKPDVAVLDTSYDQYQVWIYYNGQFGSPAGYTIEANVRQVGLVAADFSGSGRPSLAIVDQFGSINLLSNDGGGSFQLVLNWFAPVFTYQATFYGLAVGHFAPGGKTDGLPQLALLYVPNNTGPYGQSLQATVTYALDGEPATYPIYLGPFLDGQAASMAAGDVNGDGWDDLLIGIQGQAPVLAYGNSPPGQQGQAVSALPAAGPTGTVVIGDINGDGLPDLGAFGFNEVFSYAIQDQAGGFTGYTTSVAPPINTVNAALLVDVNGDLKPDLVWASGGNGPQALFVALNTGTTGAWLTAARQTVWTLAPGAQGALALAVGDLDGDGLLDPVVVDTQAANVEVVHNLTAFTAPPLSASVDGSSSTGNNFVNVQVGQINGRVFDDLAHDGTDLPGKPGRAGVTVYVDRNRNGRLDPGEPTSVTGPDGYYAFSLPAGTYQVRWSDDATRHPTSPDGGVRQVVVPPSGAPRTGLDFGSAVGLDRVLTVPAGSGGADWALVVNRGRLEVRDSVLGVIDSEPLAEQHSLTVVAAGDGPTRLTIDVPGGGFIPLAGGVTFAGVAGAGDGLRLVLGRGSDDVSVQGPAATIDAGLALRWAALTSLVIDAGDGNDRLSVAGTPLADGAIDLIGGPGDDRYALATRNSAVRITDTGGTDTLDFSGSGAGVAVNLGLDRGQVQRIGGGNNTLAVTGTVEELTGTPYADVLTGNGARDVIRGLAGNDVLLAGPGDTVLIGGPGNDVLLAGTGRDMLIGGAGSDVLLGYGAYTGRRPSAGSILVGGATAYDNSDPALRAILAEWASGHTLAQRVANLTNGGGSTGRLNGRYFLNAQTVQPGTADVLFGDSRTDWLLAFRGDWVIDLWHRGRRTSR